MIFYALAVLITVTLIHSFILGARGVCGNKFPLAPYLINLHVLVSFGYF